MEAKKQDLIKASNEKIADAVIRAREGKIKIKPGYDGVYGEPIFENNTNNEKEEIKENKQQGLNKFFWLFIKFEQSENFTKLGKCKAFSVVYKVWHLYFNNFKLY